VKIRVPVLLLTLVPLLDAKPNWKKAYEWTKRAVIAGHVADVVSTEYGLARGAVEGNPLMRNRGMRLGIKTAIIGGMLLVDRKINKDEQTYKTLTIVYGTSAIALGAVAARNVMIGKEMK